MKVALICCPLWGDYSPPFSIATLQAYLKKKGHEVAPMDFNVEFCNSYPLRSKILKQLFHFYSDDISGLFYLFNLFNKKIYGQYIKKIIESDADAICFSTYKSNGLISAYFAKRIKEKIPKKKVIFGGPFCYSKQAMDNIIHSKCVDTIIIGEGERTLLKELKDVKNAVQKCRVIHVKASDLTDLNNEPVPDFDGMPLSEYKYNLMPYGISRGCVKKCTFCRESAFWQVYRVKSAKKVINDLKILKRRYGINHFHFTDSLLNGNPKQLNELCNLIIKDRLNIKWFGFARCKSLNERLLKNMKKAGCISLLYGIESGSQKILNVLKKGYKIEEVENIVKTTFRIGIPVDLNMIIGTPTENWLDFYKTLKFVYRLRKNLNYVYINMLGLKGGEFYDNAKSYGIVRKNSVFWGSKGNSFLIRLIRFMILNGLVALVIQRKNVPYPKN